MVVYYHGGGFILGDLDTVEATCRSIANGANCLVVSVDYRLAPEHPYPTAIEDGYASLLWVVEHGHEFQGDVQHISVAGYSAGATIATAVAQLVRGNDAFCIAQPILIYPPLDFVVKRPEIPELGSTNPLSKEAMAYFDSLYFRDESDKLQPMASPALQLDLTGMPPTLLITAEYDPLREEGKAYAEKLRQADVPVTYHCYEGMMHGFFTMAGVLDQAKVAMQQVCDTLRHAFLS